MMKERCERRERGFRGFTGFKFRFNSGEESFDARGRDKGFDKEREFKMRGEREELINSFGDIMSSIRDDSRRRGFSE